MTVPETTAQLKRRLATLHREESRSPWLGMEELEIERELGARACLKIEQREAKEKQRQAHRKEGWRPWWKFW